MIKKNAFTLIELLVVVAVISMLMSFTVYSFSQAKKKSRDARREEDMKQLQNVLNVYASGFNLYPKCGRAVVDGASDCLSSILLSTRLVVQMAVDPRGGGSGSCGTEGDYVYCYTSEDGLGYTLEYNLETDNISGKSEGWQTITVVH